jgi:hypothetical protein
MTHVIVYNAMSKKLKETKNLSRDASLCLENRESQNRYQSFAMSKNIKRNKNLRRDTRVLP